MQSTGIKKPRSKRPTRGAQNRTLGLHPLVTQEQNPVDTPNNSSNNNNAVGSQPHMSWADTVTAMEQQSLPFQTQRYKDWKRNGSVHESYCRVCFQSSDSLEPCFTCRLAFHSACLPAGWVRNAQNQLFCVLCVRRAWHVVPPALTPPISPGLVASTAAASAATGPDSALPSPSPHQAVSHRQPGTASPTREQREQAIPVSDSSPEILPEDNRANDSQPAPARRPRKSRYISLPSEVDASLNILYRELESTTSLRLEIEELRNENIRCLQKIRIRDLSLLALRRELDHRRSSEQELEKLQENAAQSENVRKQIQELQGKNEALEAELRASREAAREAQCLVDDWKAKLAVLINN